MSSCGGLLLLCIVCTAPTDGHERVFLHLGPQLVSEAGLWEQASSVEVVLVASPIGRIHHRPHAQRRRRRSRRRRRRNSGVRRAGHGSGSAAGGEQQHNGRMAEEAQQLLLLQEMRIEEVGSGGAAERLWL